MPRAGSATNVGTVREEAAAALCDHGGLGRGYGGLGPIVLVHGLMGRGATWQRQVPWLRRFGRVYTVDAAWHRGADEAAQLVERGLPADEIATERFVADLAEILFCLDQGPAVLVGHSMGGLHSWCVASEFPELVAGVVVEDMAPDFRGQTTGAWAPWFDSWPDRFDGPGHAEQMFGEVAGRYFYEAFDDGRLHGSIPVWAAISEEWGTRDFWQQWESVEAPSLLLEAEHTVTPPGQMWEMSARNPRARYQRVPGAGHLLHDDDPGAYRNAVEGFLTDLAAAPGS